MEQEAIELRGALSSISKIFEEACARDTDSSYLFFTATSLGN
jgi:hypothetical protein